MSRASSKGSFAETGSTDGSILSRLSPGRKASAASSVMGRVLREKKSLESVIPELHMGGLSRSAKALTALYDEASVSDVNTLKFVASPESTNIYKWVAWEAASNELLSISIGKDKREKDAPQIVRGTAIVDASVDEVMSILISDTTERLNSSMKQLDQTFLGGEVLCTVYPTEMPYIYPCLPLCTIKRTCHELEMGRSARDFVFVECCKFAQDLATGEKVGVRTMKSIQLNEVPPNVRGSSCTRAQFLEGSGIVVRAAEHPGASEITFILRVDLGSSSKMRRAAAFFGKSKPEMVSRMLYVVEQIRAQVEEAVSTCGSWSEFKNLDRIQIQETRKDSVTILPGKLRKQTGTTTWIKDTQANEAETQLDENSSEPISRNSSSTSELSQVEAAKEVQEEEKREAIEGSDGAEVDDEGGSVAESSGEAVQAAAPIEPVRSESPVEAYMPHVVELSIVQSLLFEMVTSISSSMGEGLQTEQDEELAEIERLRIKMLEDEKAELIRELDQFKSIEAEKQKLQDELSKWKKKVEEYETNPEGERSSRSTPVEKAQTKGGDSGGVDGESELLKKYQAVLAKYEAIKASIPGAGEIDCIDGTLEDAEAKLKEFAIKIQENPDDIEAENMIERIDQFIRNHPEYKMRKEKERQSWKDANLEKNKTALAEMKTIMTEEVLKMNKDQLLAHFKEKPMLAKRVEKFRKTYKAYYTDSSALAKLHVASIVQDYQAKKLDIVELRAFYACLPKVFVADNGKKKAAWRESVAEKLINLTQKEEAGSLSMAEKRNPAYTKKPPRKIGTPVGPRKFGQAQRSGGKLNPLAASLQAQLAGRMAKDGKPSSVKGSGPPSGLLSAIKQRNNVEQSSKAPPSFLNELKGKTPAQNSHGTPPGPKPSFLDELKKKKKAAAPLPTSTVASQSVSQKPSFLNEIKSASTAVRKPKEAGAQPSFLDGIKRKKSPSKVETKPSFLEEVKHKKSPRSAEAPSFLEEIKKKKRDAGESKSPAMSVHNTAQIQPKHSGTEHNQVQEKVSLAKPSPSVEETGKNATNQRVPSSQQETSVMRKPTLQENAKAVSHNLGVKAKSLSEKDSKLAGSEVEINGVLTRSNVGSEPAVSPPKKPVDGSKLQELNKKVELLKRKKREMKAAQAKATQQSQSKAERLRNIQSQLKKIPSKRMSKGEVAGEQDDDAESPPQFGESTAEEKKTSLKQYSSRSLIEQMLKEQKAEKT